MFGFNNLVPYNRNQKQDFLDSFFNEPFFPMFFGNDMKTDIKEAENDYVVSAEIPGVSKQDIGIDYSENDVLSISVNKCEEKEEKKEGYIRKERCEKANRREFYLPNVASDKISAKYENGVLTVTLPKIKGKTNGQKIIVE